jgi:DNA-binding SARP family transcriptional activator/pimeloyl-ACP methyl ester carboxylesterase
MRLIRVRVLGPVTVADNDGAERPVERPAVRALLAALVTKVGRVITVDDLVASLWPEGQPDNPTDALHSRLRRLRQVLNEAGLDGALSREPAGYRLSLPEDEIDVVVFEDLMKRAGVEADPAARLAHLDEALSLWRGTAYAEFPDNFVLRLEAIRLDELRLAALEKRGGLLLEIGRAADAVADMEQFVRENPHRELAWSALMRGLYATGRQVDATRAYDDYRKRLANDLGLEPTSGLQQLFDLIVRGESLAHQSDLSPIGLAALSIEHQRLPDGRRLAVGSVGTGPTVLAIPQWISRLDMIAEGHDMRASIWDRLSRHVRLVLYDRWATGLSPGELTDTSLDAAIFEAEQVAEASGGPLALFAMSGAGPIALGLAARRPDLVAAMVLWGTFASPRGVFNLAAKEGILAMARAHWGLGSRTMAEMHRPGSPPDTAEVWGRYLRAQADEEVAMAYLEAIYGYDVTESMHLVQAPVLVLHYRKDRVVPFAGALQLVAGLADARFIPLEGNRHLPDVGDLELAVGAIKAFLDDHHAH